MRACTRRENCGNTKCSSQVNTHDSPCKLPSIWLLHWSPKLCQVLKWPAWMEVPWWGAAFRSLKAILQRELHLLPLGLKSRLLFHSCLIWLHSQAANRVGHTSALFEFSSTNLLLTNLVIGPLHCLLWIQDPQVLQTILPEIMNHLNHLVGRG